MTCIVGVEHEGKVYLAGDSSSVSGYDNRETCLHKVFHVDKKFIIGYTSSFRMGQILQYKLHVENKPNGISDIEYMATYFVDTVRDILKENGYATIESNEETGGNFLVGYNGKLYNIEPDFQANRALDGFDAVGIGKSYALASLYLLKDLKPKKRLKKSLQVATKFSIAVCEPFRYVKL